jgi:REP element-mobilizing transposase RayT
LRDYDYARAGAYFISIVTYERECIFGEIIDGEMRLNTFGKIVQEEWFQSAEIRREIDLPQTDFVIIPNHIHGIVWINGETVGAHGVRPVPRPRRFDVVERAGRPGARHDLRQGARHAPLRQMPRSLGSFVAGYKAIVTKRVNALRRTEGAAVWHRNYYEHVIRDEVSLLQMREYVANNPAKWDLDRENPRAAGRKPEDDWLR